jgi:hypothetical protein
MARLGHSSVRAAMIYQHATRDRDRAIAKALGALVREVRQETAEVPDERQERGERDGWKRPRVARMWHETGAGSPRRQKSRPGNMP